MSSICDLIDRILLLKSLDANFLCLFLNSRSYDSWQKSRTATCNNSFQNQTLFATQLSAEVFPSRLFSTALFRIRSFGEVYPSEHLQAVKIKTCWFFGKLHSGKGHIFCQILYLFDQSFLRPRRHEIFDYETLCSI